jgi:hypothetical protein
MKFIMISVIFVVLSTQMIQAGLSPKFIINPKDSVEVGEEVMFSAMRTSYPENSALLRKARYEWDFGDGYSFKYGVPQASSCYSGIAVVHYFMKPGKFTVKLTVSVFSSFSSEGEAQGTPVTASYSSSIIVSGEAPLQGFSLLHASFVAHLAQYVYVTIPSEFRGAQTSLRIKLIGPAGDSTVLMQKSNLTPEEKFLFNQKSLVQGEYVLVAELLGANNSRIKNGILREKISKPYSGVPKVGIDENNAFNIDGKPFFPIATFMTSLEEIQPSIDSAAINALHTEGYYNDHTISTWSDYLTIAANKKLMCIGPTRGSWSWGEDWPGPRAWQFNHDIDTIAQYVNSNKGKSSMFAWSWEDEPNMGGRSSAVYPPVLAAWQYVCHKNDPQHPVGNGLYLYDWLKYYGTSNYRDMDFLSSDTFFGGKKWVQDVIGGDAYPLSARLHPSLNYTDIGPVAAYLDGVDRFIANNKNLAPFLPYVQPCNEQATDSIPPPTPNQVTMLTWLNVIHGAKGILWFPLFDVKSIQWNAMKMFSKQITPLTSIILSRESTRKISNDAVKPLNRVDVMIRDQDSTTYLFAARVTEPAQIREAKYPGVEPKIIEAHFSVDGAKGTSQTQVLYENRTITTINGQFADTFSLNAVHIYKLITSQKILHPPKKKNRF